MMELQYNGQAYKKRFVREFIALMCANAKTPCCAAAGINWRRSSRTCLRVHNARVFERLRHCSERYFWPDGNRFWCQPHRRHRPRRCATWSPHRASEPRTLDDDALDDYAKTYGYDQEDGELTPLHQNINNLNVK
ncbi:LEF6 [Hyphantria cunea nucleopolyhedrovirus]|uniref:LEF6 n=1 Tax=Hyphantria cunea nuclear polyhedrosis virus TaxID=28288 RepID=Q2NP41_NPVHC|nr:LEF6 [Hyphantria cunea nucleopolyhedrovirus]BAE72404.1 LEF6 [Hyphantria cunea nucleopolyhedrovirus]